MFRLRKYIIVSAIALVTVFGITTSAVQAKIEHMILLVLDNTSKLNLELHIVEPSSLRDLPGRDPLPLGRNYLAALSPDRHTLAAVIWQNEYQARGTLHLFNLEAWEDNKTSLDKLTFVSAMTFSSDGKTLYWLEQSGLSRLKPWDVYSYDIEHGGDAELIGQLPLGVMPQQMRITKSGLQLVIFATPETDMPTTTTSATTTEVSQVVFVNLREKRVEATIKLDGLVAGFHNLTDPKTGNFMMHEYNQPGVAWDLDANLLYVAHPTVDRLTVVDLSLKTIAKEVDFASAKTPGHAKMMKGTERIAAVNPAGDGLFISTRRSDVVMPDDGKIDKAVQIMQPLGVQMINVKEMKEARQTSLPLFEMALSPNGEYLVATGIVSNQPMNGDGKTTYSGVYVLDAKTLQPLKHFDTPDKYIRLNGFSADGLFAYFSVDPYNSGSTSSSLRAIDLKKLEIGAERSIKSGYIDVLGTLNTMPY